MTYEDGILYAVQVAKGDISVCRNVRLACQRHRNDLAAGAQRGLVFDLEAAQHILDFFGFLRHSKGEWAGRVIELEDWQQALLWIGFGWMRSDGKRRFRTH